MPIWFVLIGLGLALASCGDEEEPTVSPQLPPPDPPTEQDKKSAATKACSQPEVRQGYAYISESQVHHVPIVFHRLLSGEYDPYPRRMLEGTLEKTNAFFNPLGFQFSAQQYLEYSDPLLIKYFNRKPQSPHDPSQDSEDFSTLREHYASVIIKGVINVFLLPRFQADGKVMQHVGVTVEESIQFSYYGTVREFLAHEIGHYFNLRHTFEEAGLPSGFKSKELVDGSNALESGDELSDTPADPGPTGLFLEGGCLVDLDCNIIECSQDVSGDTYQPDVGNLMSYYTSCLDHFSNQQMQLMRCYAEKYWGASLLNSQPLTSLPFQAPKLITVGCDNTSLPNLESALSEIAEGGTIEICEGTYLVPQLFILGGSIIIKGRGGHAVFLQAQDIDQRLMTLARTSTSLQNLTLTQGSGEAGGALFISESYLYLENVNFEDNHSPLGSIMYVRDSEVEMEGGYVAGSEPNEPHIVLASRRGPASFNSNQVDWDLLEGLSICFQQKPVDPDAEPILECSTIDQETLACQHSFEQQTCE